MRLPLPALFLVLFSSLAHAAPADPATIDGDFLPWILVGVLGSALVSALGWAGIERRRAQRFDDELARTKVYFQAVARFAPRLPERGPRES